MSLFQRTPVDPAVIAAQAAARREAAQAEIERVRLQAQLDRELREAAAEEDRRRAIADEEETRRRHEVRRQERAAARERRRTSREEFLTKLRPVLPLLLINAGAAYAQAAYAYADIAPADWQWPAKLTFAIAFAAALESIAVYVQWHAHDALLLKAHATAAALRRASWVIAGIVGVINYAHFADGVKPTAAAVAFALLSLLSPWLWGLHTRRAQHVQLLAEDANLIDEGGVEFSPQRRRAFPIRSWMAKRWSIDHYERDPRRAWEGYNAERVARQAARRAEKEARRAEKAAADVERDLAEAGDDATPVDPWDYAEPIGPQPAPVPVDTARPRVRWRTPLHRRPRRMGRPQPQITVVLPETAPAAKAAKPSSSAGRPGRPSQAQKVASFAARFPQASIAELARKARLSEDTIRRHLPRPTAAVNGHNHTQQ
ncbi:hypothetical protein [Micromonospora sp. NBRC 101691]|uniref:hypothetical protein n=1 Tax=Micromonospora sp. NBRC 101691 TaxID=3032198 RepID=UPI0024A2D3B5|nr:hypothetical protein [Micromonospora sp. NBRC 101691]GLY21717.1 hypothetical protein Misp04_14490 [Micromonospora sp. NBRC 101691]